MLDDKTICKNIIERINKMAERANDSKNKDNVTYLLGLIESCCDEFFSREYDNYGQILYYTGLKECDKHPENETEEGFTNCKFCFGTGINKMIDEDFD